ncbi:Chromosome partition protein Smc [Carpediemonas membranifera]|uniref:Chromosome partition protein Smc n=1 Tax=Carpediemonas membranifera TaxID=201153 RepID=A0A8J6E4B0_9EUKA|nr:Chromosome partition protein Smc [Carpediemonas membranifera]|eukprot:KAG9396983.1 Chromosome partition protein Smc [Carpediemonas membranifera]
MTDTDPSVIALSHLKAELIDQKKSLNSKISDLEARLAVATADVAEYRKSRDADTKSHQDELSKLREAMKSQKDRHAAELSQREDKLRRAMASLKDEHAAKIKRVSGLLRDLQEAGTRSRSLLDEAREQAAEVSTARESRPLKDRIAVLERELDVVRGECRQQEATIARLSEERTELTLKAGEARQGEAVLKNTAADLDVMTQERDALASKVKRLEIEARDTRRQLHAANQRLEEAEAEAAELMSNAEALRYECSELRTQARAHGDAADIAEHRNRRMVALVSEVEGMRHALEDRDAEVRRLKAEVEAAEKRCKETVEAKNDEFKAKLSSFETLLAGQRDWSSRLKHTKQQLEEEQAAREEVEDRVSELEDEIYETKEALTKATKALAAVSSAQEEEFRKRLEPVQAELTAQFQQERREHMAESERLRKRVRELQEKLRAKTAELRQRDETLEKIRGIGGL